MTTDTKATRPEPKALHPSALRQNHDGLCWASWLLRLREDLTFNDLYERPNLWRAIQGGGSGCLKRFDRLLVVDFNETTAHDVIVIHATDSMVVLSKPRIIELTSRETEPAYVSEKYVTRWAGNGYATFRLDNGQRVTNPTQSRSIAEREHRDLYPRRIA